MKSYLKGLGIVVAGLLVVGSLGTIAYPQGAATLVQLIYNGALLSNSNGLPVNIVAGGSSSTVTQGPAGTNAAAWWMRLGDTTNGPVAVKPASTAAAQTDPALVTRNPDIGTTSDAVCGTSTGTCTELQLAKYANAQLASIVAGLLTPPVYSSNDPCAQATKTNVPFTTNGTSSVQLVGLSGSTTIYVCSLSFIAAGATTVAFTTGTDTACVTGNAAVIGSTTAGIANSLSFAANGGLTLGNGGGTIAKGAASSEFCMINGTNVYVSGNLTYVQH